LLSLAFAIVSKAIKKIPPLNINLIVMLSQLMTDLAIASLVVIVFSFGVGYRLIERSRKQN
jgi:hypothetical protein